MKIKLTDGVKTVMSNPMSRHGYFGWPTAARLQDGRIAVAASGFRVGHVCPFGKLVVSYSDDEGETYTAPAPVIDTVLDDRDGGIVPFGKTGVMVTSFNNTVGFQRKCAKGLSGAIRSYFDGYLDTVSQEEQDKFLGATFKFSNDCGKTFGELYKSPITSPHGPCVLPDGRLLWVGRTFSAEDSQLPTDGIKAYIVNTDGTMEYVGEIENIPEIDGVKNPLSCEPHAIVLDDGTVLAHIRVQNYVGTGIFTIYQSESHDFGKTWSKPVRILEKMGGAPSHLFKHSSGMLIATYGYRCSPCGIKAMFSRDNGKSWDTGYDIYVTDVTDKPYDLGYPATVELKDGSLLTVFYAHRTNGRPAEILQQKWTFEE